MSKKKRQQDYDKCLSNNPCKQGRWINADSRDERDEMYFKQRPTTSI